MRGSWVLLLMLSVAAVTPRLAAQTVKLAIVASDDATTAKNALLATGRFTQIDAFDARVSIPSLATLSAYDAVLAWTNFVPVNATTMGNTLADYYDLGGKKVVVATYAFSNPWEILGRIQTSPYSALTDVLANADVSGSIGATVPGDPIFSGVNLGSVFYFHTLHLSRFAGGHNSQSRGRSGSLYFQRPMGATAGAL